MKGFIVCLSGISVEKRPEIYKLVGFMGGLGTKNLIESTTHLITNTNKSPKYEVSFAFISYFFYNLGFDHTSQCAKNIYRSSDRICLVIYLFETQNTGN